MKLLLVFLACIFITSFAAADNDCTKKGIAPKAAAPSAEVLRDAALAYQAIPNAARCLYPDVTIKPIPVGEYEIQTPSGPTTMTLSDRTLWSWGPYRYVTALVTAPAGSEVKTLTLSSGQVLLEASVKSDKTASSR